MKKVISVFLCCLILTFCVCLPSSAVGEKTVFYLNYGNVYIDEYGASGYDINGKYVSENNPLGYVITQKNPNSTINKGITVSAAECSVELLNLNIRRYDEYDCAFAVKSNADVTVTLSGENHLVSGSSRAGLEVGMSVRVTINGEGTLYAQSNLQAGIGGGEGQSNGTLVIDSGTVYATGGIDGYSAGIGGGTNGNGGNITVNGGFVTANGGLYAAGIGGGYMSGGGNITINAGVVTATGGAGGAGIGSGYQSGGTTNIVINDASVKAVAGMYADNIGNGYRATTEFNGIHNSDGNSASLVNLSVSDFKNIFVNGIDTSPITAPHPDDDKLYIYTDSTSKIVTEYMNDGSVKFFKLNNAGTEQIYPYSSDCERFDDKLITGDIMSISVADGFSVNNNTLVYNSVNVDSFTPVLRGDVNFDGELNGMDAVVVDCVINSMLSDVMTIKLSDADGNGTINKDDVDLLAQYGLRGDIK